MFVFKLRNMLLILFLIIALIFSFFMLLKPDRIETMSNSYTNIIVIDAGHGWPDGGATVNNIAESDINISIAKKLEEELLNMGYEIVMTREDENNIADVDKQNSISSTKQSDLNNRVKIINESKADICISIHMNKYSSSKYWGWQTFYSEKSEEGKRLAGLIQNGINSCIEKENKRQPLKITGIKIVDKTNIPVVIVECGFLSNEEELKLLQNEDYQQKLVKGICIGVQEFY